METTRQARSSAREGAAAAPPTHMPAGPGEPYCSNCGYNLTGATETAVCPECGRPLVEVLVRGRATMRGRGRRYESQTTFMGWPVVHIAQGADPEKGETVGVAKGLIAIGDRAYGGIAIGGFAMGGVAIGGSSVGVCSLGGGSIGLFTALGGGAIGGFAVGGGAAGVVASGGGALGVIASGGGAIGWFARGGGTYGRHVINPRGADPEATKVFDALSPVLGQGLGTMITPAVYAVAATVGLGLLICIVALWAVRRSGIAAGDAAARGQRS